MRRTFTPPTSLLLTLLSILSAPLSGAEQIRANTSSPFFSDAAGPTAKEAAVTARPMRTVNDPSVANTEVSLFLAPSQSTATLQGRIIDPNGAVVPGAKITARHQETGVNRLGESDNYGNYQIAALVVGSYRVEVRAGGFRTAVVESLSVEVARIVVQDFRLEVGDITQTISVTSEARLIEAATVSVGQVIDQRTVQELPLNGRHFIDLGLLVPGSVTPPQNGNLSPPARGQGSFALNTAGNREDTINYQINGINLNDQINNIITFLPPISSIQEFKFDNSTFSAEYGRNSGAIVNIDINALTPVARFGNLGRNVIIGPGFNNVDFSVIKNIKLDEDMRLQFRAEVFDLFNHPSFGQPGRVVGSETFGQIVNTRFPTGDSGSSRQLQFALKFMF